MIGYESEFKASKPTIRWDEPIKVRVGVAGDYWCCRYCIAKIGMKGQDVIDGKVDFAFAHRQDAFRHIHRVHG